MRPSLSVYPCDTLRASPPLNLPFKQWCTIYRPLVNYPLIPDNSKGGSSFGRYLIMTGDDTNELLLKAIPRSRVWTLLEPDHGTLYITNEYCGDACGTDVVLGKFITANSYTGSVPIHIVINNNTE